jgi:hypothetical protein
LPICGAGGCTAAPCGPFTADTNAANAIVTTM